MNERGGRCVREETSGVVDCPVGTKRVGGECAATADTDCPEGMHLNTARACVANATPQAPEEERAAIVPVAMVAIPAGTFDMGAKDGAPDEQPVHSVRVEAFEMDRTEVTVEAYGACLRAGKCTPPATLEYCNWGQNGVGSHPINCVSWYQAKAFCEYAGKRLPTEEEWEFAARGTDGRTYPWGSGAPSGQLCWNRWDSATKSTCAVGSFSSGDSPFGVQDMAGNVWEWTASGYSRDYSKKREERTFVCRGGSWDSNHEKSVGSARRLKFTPDYYGMNLGFRCVR